MTDAELVDHICTLPQRYWTSAVSWADAISDLPSHRDLGKLRQLIVEHLRKNQLLVDDWLRWSSDKRTTSGWYLLDDATIGWHPNGPRYRRIDIHVACAEFILKETNLE